MRTLRLFISSVQKEFATERATLVAYLRGDPLLRRFFEPFLFEEVPAADRRADEVYLDEVQRCDVYVGLFGHEYGFEDTEGVSPTEREFDVATRRRKHRLIFVKGADDRGRHPKMQALIRKAGNQLVRRRFGTTAELVSAVYASLVDYLAANELVRTGPFDTMVCRDAKLRDLSEDKIRQFVRLARRARGFPLPQAAGTKDVLTHLNLIRGGRPTHAAVLLFGSDPQRFLLSSQVKCAHFHGTQVAKPIPSYQVYKGTVFDLVDQAVDFVLSKINLAVGTREHSTQAPVAYEMPPQVVREAIVNAVAHRDYTSTGSVQVMLFADRLEVWNPGTLPPSLTLEMLRQPHGSVPGNPLLAEPLYLTKYIERMGTGTGDMIKRCRKAGLPEPEFTLTDGFVTTIRRNPALAFEAVGGKKRTGKGQVAGEVTGEVVRRPESQPESQPESGKATGQVAGEVGRQPDSIESRVLRFLVDAPRGKAEISSHLGQKEISGRLNQVIRRLLAEQSIQYTIPSKPNSRLQKYRLTENGAAYLAALRKGESPP